MAIDPSTIPDTYANRKKEDYQPGNPYWFNGSHESNASSYAYDEFYKLAGRAPTETEIAQFVPIYLAGDPNTGNVGGGNAAVAQYISSRNITNPETAKGNYDTVNNSFKSVLGRDATQEEKDHFGSLISSQNIDPYSLNQFLQQLPESVQKKDAAFRTSLTNDLQSQDSRYYNEQVMPGIAKNFAKQGRSFDSSAYAQALAQAAQGQNRQRESFLANLSAQQYGGSQANARQDYLGGQARSYQLQDASTSLSNDYNMYNLQQNAYNQYLQRYGKRKPDAFDYTNLAFNGINALANAYGATKGGSMSGGGGGGSQFGALPYGAV